MSIGLNYFKVDKRSFITKLIDTPIWEFDNCNLSGINRLLLHAETSDLPAFLFKLISEEHAPVIKEFPDWVEL